MSDQILTQEEIDALLSAMDKGEVDLEEEVRQETKEVIRKAGEGGGLICMSSNSVHSGVKPENYVAMVKAIKEYGQYPLSVD